MSLAGDARSRQPLGSRSRRIGLLAALCAISGVGASLLGSHATSDVGAIRLPVAVGLDLVTPTAALAARKPTAARAKPVDGSANATSRRVATSTSDDGAQAPTFRRGDAVKIDAAFPAVAHALALKPESARTIAADAAPGRAAQAPRADDADRAFATAFTQAATRPADTSTATASVDRAALSISTGGAPSTVGAFAPRQAGGARYESGGVSAANRLGSIGIRSEAQVGHLETGAAAMNKPSYDAVNVHTSFTVPAFHHAVQVSVGGGYERMLQTGGPHFNSLDLPPTVEGSAAIDGAGAASALNNAGRLSLNRAGYATSITVPVASGVNVGVGYAQRNVSGGAGMTQAAPIDEQQHLYTGSVTYQGRGGRSSVSLIGRESRATDSTATAPDTKVRRGDLVFSVKF